MAYPRTHCPGSRRAPDPPVCTPRKRGPLDGPLYAFCPCCKRDYALDRYGRLRIHKGLPAAADGGCPYRCPPDCDFDCYFPGTT